jgi:hypothetical protein
VHLCAPERNYRVFDDRSAGGCVPSQDINRDGQFRTQRRVDIMSPRYR